MYGESIWASGELWGAVNLRASDIGGKRQSLEYDVGLLSTWRG